MFNFFIKGKKPKGIIQFLHLEDWWLTNLTPDERQQIENIYKPMGLGDGYSLIEGDITHSSLRVLSFLTTLSGWFDNTKNRSIAEKILRKASDFASDPSTDILDLHFYFAAQMRMSYKKRDENVIYLDKAIEFCRMQIDIAKDAAMAFMKESFSELPGHEGYLQLCIILEKQGLYKEAIEIAEQAKKQGWSGSWDSRIEKLNKKIFKQK